MEKRKRHFPTKKIVRFSRFFMVKCVFYVNSQSSPLSLEANKQQELLNDACKIFCRCLVVFGVSILYAYSLYSAINKHIGPMFYDIILLLALLWKL